MHAIMPPLLLALAGYEDHVGPIELGHRSSLQIEQPAVSAGIYDGSIHVEVDFTLSTEQVVNRDRFIVLRVPRYLHVVALTVSSGQQRLNAGLVDAVHARAAYREIVRPVESRRDPALLEWLASSTDDEHYRLRVFPVVKGQPMRVHLELDSERGGVDKRRSLMAVDGPRFVPSAPQPISSDRLCDEPCLPTSHDARLLRELLAERRGD
jgi:hypothetical protein